MISRGKAEAVGGSLRSVFVVSVVGDRRVELVQEVSVCAVDFYAVIAGFLDAEGLLRCISVPGRGFHRR